MKAIFIKVLAVVLLLLSVEVANAQFIIKKHELQNANLTSEIIYIQTKRLTEKQTKYLQRSNTLDTVTARYESENEFLTNLVNEKWNFSNTLEELDEISIENKIKNKDDVWYISLNRHTDRFFDRRVHKQNYYYNYSHYELSLFKNKKEVISIPLVDEELSELDLTFAIHSIQVLLSESESFQNLWHYSKTVNTNANQLEGKTLLVSDKLTDYSQEYLQQFFEGKIRIVSEKEILSAIHAKEEQSAYLLITINDYSKEPSFNHLIVDCATNMPFLIYRNSSAYSKPCKHSCIVHQADEQLEFLFGFHFKKYQKLIKS